MNFQMMLHNHCLYNLSQKRMLKGIKKTKPVADEEESHIINPRIDQNALKNELMQEDQMNVQPNQDELINIELEKQRKQKYQECYDLFLQGQTIKLQEKLKALKKEVLSQKHGGAQAKVKSGKFQYNINFDDDEQKKTKQKLKKRNRPIMASNRIKEYCIYCPDNEQLHLLSASNYVYLALAKRKTFRNYFHFILAPVDHQQTMIGLNQDLLTQISNYKKCLLQAFDKVNFHVIFFEQYFQQNSHIFIQCLVISYNKAQDLPFYFKQGLEDIEGNWSTHKNIIKIEKEKGGIQKQIPRAIKYFYIDFSLGYGYAHVIENERQWKRQYCYEMLATALGLESHQVKTTQQFTEEQVAAKREKFQKIWSPFDWTKLI